MNRLEIAVRLSQAMLSQNTPSQEFLSRVAPTSVWLADELIALCAAPDERPAAVRGTQPANPPEVPHAEAQET